MTTTRVPWVPVLAIVVLLLFVVSLPGLGIETRPFTSYAPWAGPVFLVLTIIIFATGIAVPLLHARRPRLSLQLSFVLGAAAIATVAFDTSHIGGLPPPLAPLVLGLIAAVVAAGLLFTAAWAWKQPGAEPVPASNQPP